MWVVHCQVVFYVLGEDVGDIDVLFDCIVEIEFKFFGFYVCWVLVGFDMVLWDLCGKREGKSVCEFFGGMLCLLVVYGFSMCCDIIFEDEVQCLVWLCDQYGFNVFKICIGKECGYDEDEWLGCIEVVVL